MARVARELWDGRKQAPAADLDRTFRLAQTPLLLSHYGESLAGRWRLWVVDRSIDIDNGVLNRWQLWHRH